MFRAIPYYVFENFRNKRLEIYELDPAQVFTVLGLV